MGLNIFTIDSEGFVQVYDGLGTFTFVKVGITSIDIGLDILAVMLEGFIEELNGLVIFAAVKMGNTPPVAFLGLLRVAVALDTYIFWLLIRGFLWPIGIFSFVFCVVS